MYNSKSARFDTRWKVEEKELFEYASKLGGYKSLSDFVFHSVHEKAKKIIEENNKILASTRDKEIFFEVIMNPPEPNEKLKEASRKYNDLFNK